MYYLIMAEADEVLEEKYPVMELANYIRELVEDLQVEKVSPGMFTEIITNFLNEVDWYEIAEDHIKEAIEG